MCSNNGNLIDKSFVSCECEMKSMSQGISSDCNGSFKVSKGPLKELSLYMGRGRRRFCWVGHLFYAHCMSVEYSYEESSVPPPHINGKILVLTLSHVLNPMDFP